MALVLPRLLNLLRMIISSLIHFPEKWHNSLSTTETCLLHKPHFLYTLKLFPLRILSYLLGLYDLVSAFISWFMFSRASEPSTGSVKRFLSHPAYLLISTLKYNYLTHSNCLLDSLRPDSCLNLTIATSWNSCNFHGKTHHITAYFWDCGVHLLTPFVIWGLVWTQSVFYYSLGSEICMLTSYYFLRFCFYEYRCCACMYFCAPCVYSAYRGQKITSEDRTGVTDCHEVSCKCRDLN